jgi:hypothetical protein
MNVSVAQAAVDVGNGQAAKKNILIVTKDFNAGEEIYKVNYNAVPCNSTHPVGRRIQL